MNIQKLAEPEIPIVKPITHSKVENIFISFNDVGINNIKMEISKGYFEENVFIKSTSPNELLYGTISNLDYIFNVSALENCLRSLKTVPVIEVEEYMITSSGTVKLIDKLHKTDKSVSASTLSIAISAMPVVVNIVEISGSKDEKNPK